MRCQIDFYKNCLKQGILRQTFLLDNPVSREMSNVRFCDLKAA